ncbi:Xaa-Pro peptidase family protein [Herbiconiux sp. L3-i23]|uniref:M24 family metallopeptidase n=1 Tax=Herbiconiux sp. L3-i23 TaxID=2905871 RepID=UPI002045E75D|nr:Xaa-Pro peptidase family protein [Herbiconiux sp. L3-i23]BDI21868.1 dipeptidase [Herbiconiux sp. L3-i23]
MAPITIDHPARVERLWAKLDEHRLDLVFLPASQSDFEYFTGVARRAPSFGGIGYANHWISGAFIAPGTPPLYVLTKHYQDFDMPAGMTGDVITARDGDDGGALFAQALDRFGGGQRRIGVASRSWAETSIALAALRPAAEIVVADRATNELRRIKDADEIELMRQAAGIVDLVYSEIEPTVVVGVTELELASRIDLRMRQLGSPGPSFDTGVFALGPGLVRDADVRVSTEAPPRGSAVSFDFGAIAQGYCNDFGRTVHLGDPSEEYERVYDLVIAAQEAGRAAAVPGATGSDVHAATRAVIVDGGYGEWFRHRTGHCIGLDVHELPYISEEDHTPLEPGMLFTIEPSVFWPGRVGVRVEDVFLLTENGAEAINRHPHAMVANR